MLFCPGPIVGVLTKETGVATFTSRRDARVVAGLEEGKPLHEVADVLPLRTRRCASGRRSAGPPAACSGGGHGIAPGIAQVHVGDVSPAVAVAVLIDHIDLAGFSIVRTRDDRHHVTTGGPGRQRGPDVAAISAMVVSPEHAAERVVGRVDVARAHLFPEVMPV